MRVALVTGGARRIGRAIAHDLASNHATAITYHTSDPGPLGSERPDVFAIKADLANSVETARVIQSVIHLKSVQLSLCQKQPLRRSRRDISAESDRGVPAASDRAAESRSLWHDAGCG